MAGHTGCPDLYRQRPDVQQPPGGNIGSPASRPVKILCHLLDSSLDWDVLREIIFLINLCWGNVYNQSLLSPHLHLVWESAFSPHKAGDTLEGKMTLHLILWEAIISCELSQNFPSRSGISVLPYYAAEVASNKFASKEPKMSWVYFMLFFYSVGVDRLEC